MFSPPGYRSVAALIEAFQNEANEVIEAPAVALSEADYSSEDYRKLAENEWNRWVTANEGLLNFLQSGVQLSVCLPSGNVLQVHSSILAREPASNHTGFAGLWVLNSKRWMIDTRKACSWLQGADERLQKYREKSRLKRTSGMNTEKEDRKIKRLGQSVERATFLIDSFRSFEGASLIVAEDDLPSKYQVAQFLGLEPDETSHSVGRPSDREAILSSYERLFPQGNMGRSWKRITADIGEDTGIYVHPDTVKRALGLRK